MKSTDFTNNQDVLNILEELKSERNRSPEKFIFSDVVDSEGNQYVDLVQEGGGMLGIALVGYTYVLEQMGIRFVSLAGTSAGAINTILLASLGKPKDMKSLKIVELLSNKDFYEFVDGDGDAKRMLKAINEDSGILKLGFYGIQVLDNLKKDMGLNPGDHFQNWIKEILDKNGINTSEKLKKNMNSFSNDVGFRPDVAERYPRLKASLAIIAADLTTESKVVFPLMAPLYYEIPDAVHPAEFVRSSMSIPIFFKPYKIKNLPKGRKNLWKQQAQYFGKTPNEVILIDGGTLSNFAIDIFHRTTKVPTRPTFGVKLGIDRNQPNQISNYKQLIGKCFDTSRQLRDLEFIVNNPDYNHLVANVDIGEHDWMNFQIEDNAKIDLFSRGAKAAAAFLKTFNWQKYKDLRTKLLVENVHDIWRSASDELRTLK